MVNNKNVKKNVPPPKVQNGGGNKIGDKAKVVVKKEAAPTAKARNVEVKLGPEQHVEPGDSAELAYLELPFGTPTAPSIGNGTIIYREKISSFSFPGSGLDYCSRMYDKYGFEKFDVWYNPKTSSATTGGGILALFPDPEIELPEHDPDRLKRMATAVTHVKFNWWSPAKLSGGNFNQPQVRMQGGWHTNPSVNVQQNEPYQVYQGLLVLIADGALSGGTGVMSMSLDVDYRCRFSSRNIRPGVEESTTTSISLGALSGEPFFRVMPEGLGANGAFTIVDGLAPSEIALASEFLHSVYNAVVAGTKAGIATIHPAIPEDAMSGPVPAGYLFSNNSSTTLWAATNIVNAATGASNLGTGTAFGFPGETFTIVRIPYSALDAENGRAAHIRHVRVHPALESFPTGAVSTTAAAPLLEVRAHKW